MGRIRTVKPEWATDEKMKGASDEARVLSIGLITRADDYGNGEAGDLIIAGALWSALDPLEALAKASRAIRELVEIGFVEVYKVSGQSYFHIAKWSEHQRVDKPGKPLFPGPQRADKTLANDSREIPGTARESLAPDHDLRPTTYDHDLSCSSGDERERFDFAAVYAHYPRKVGKSRGLSLCRSKVKSQAKYETILAAAEEMGRLWARASKDRMGFCPQFDTWVSKDRWLDPEQVGPDECSGGSGKPEPTRAPERLLL